MPGLDSRLALAFSVTLSKSLSLWLAPFSVSKMFCMCRQVSRPDKARLELDLGKMLGGGCRSQEL